MGDTWQCLEKLLYFILRGIPQCTRQPPQQVCLAQTSLGTGLRNLGREGCLRFRRKAHRGKCGSVSLNPKLPGLCTFPRRFPAMLSDGIVSACQLRPWLAFCYCKGLGHNYFKLCGLYCLCRNYSTLYCNTKVALDTPKHFIP